MPEPTDQREKRYKVTDAGRVVADTNVLVKRHLAEHPTDQREMERRDHERALGLLRAYGTPDPDCGCMTCTFARALLRMKAAVDAAPHADDCRKTKCCMADAATCRKKCDCWKAEL